MLELIEQAAGLKHPKVLELSLDRFSIVGDIHADLTALELVLKKAFKPVIFLGDYADRGDKPAEVYRILLEGYLNGDFILLRGNHESADVFPHDLPHKLEACGFGKDIYSALKTFWDKLPLCAILNGEIFAVHGGIYTKSCRILQDGIELKDLESEDAQLEMMWNDPWEKDGCDYNYERGVGFFFGNMATEKFLEDLGLRVVVRGHEPAKVLKAEQNGMVVTVGSTGVYGTRVALINVVGTVKNGYEVVRKFGYIL